MITSLVIAILQQTMEVAVSSIIFETRKWIEQESSISVTNPLRKLRPGEHEAIELGSLTDVGHCSRLRSFSQALHLRFHKKWMLAIQVSLCQ